MIISKSKNSMATRKTNDEKGSFVRRGITVTV